jgi:hypothetical protein
MKKFPKSKATGKLGVSYVERVIFGAGSIFREVPEDTDLGIDGYIEFVENEVSLGLLVAVQIKAGSSYLVQYSDGKYFTIGVTNESQILSIQYTSNAHRLRSRNRAIRLARCDWLYQESS